MSNTHELRLRISEGAFSFFQEEFGAVRPQHLIRAKILEPWIHGEPIEPAKAPMKRVAFSLASADDVIAFLKEKIGAETYEQFLVELTRMR